MPTAIVRLQTTEGFVIAADGRVRGNQNGKLEVVTDELQKIYQIEGEFLVYALYGTMGIGKDENDPDVAVNLVSAFKNAVDALHGQHFEDAVQYGNALALPIYNRIRDAKANAKIERFPERDCDAEPDQPGHVIGHVFLFGYYNGKACELDIRLFHRKQSLAQPTVTQRRLWLGYDPEIWGSDTVARLLYTSSENVFFPAYRRRKPKRQEDLTISEAIEVAKNYILACDSVTGRALDPDFCPGIGGHIHIAVITPNSFRWAVGYEPGGQTEL
jgi:hypothetical protein